MLNSKCLTECPNICESKIYISDANEKRRGVVELIAGTAALRGMDEEKQMEIRAKINSEENLIDALRNFADDGQEHVVSLLARQPELATCYFSLIDVIESFVTKMESSSELLLENCPDGPAETIAEDGLTDVTCSSRGTLEAILNMEKS